MTVNVNYAAAGGAQGGSVVQNITQSITNITQATGNQLVSGGGVVWRGNYDYTVAAATYTIQGTTYTSPQTDLSLAASDPTNDRIDLIVVNSSNVVAVITGTPSATPAQPSFDPSTQIPLTFVYVTAASTQPATAANENIYLENAEWTGTASGAGFNLASTNNPFQGTKDIEATAVVAGNYVQYVKPAAGTIIPDQFNTLVFVLRSKAAWPAGKSLVIQLYNGTSPVGTPITVKDGTSNFVSSVTGNYQFIVLATSLFQSAGLPITTIRITVAGGGGSIGFYLDYWFWQAGVSQVQTADPMIFRGQYNAAVQYAANDVVFTGSGATLATYVALAASVNKTPASNAAIWQPIGGGGGASTFTIPVNAQTGASYTFLAGDNNKLITFSNTGAVAVTLPQATGSFATWLAWVQNLNNGPVTITPTTSTIDGAATLVLQRGQGALIVSDGTNYSTSRNAAYPMVPVTSKSADYGLVLADANTAIYHPASDAVARTFTIPANASVPYPIGTCLTFANLSANSISIAITTDTMYLDGTGGTGTRTLAQYGKCTAIKVDTTTWMIGGTGVS